jgi:hypothetical protein
MEAIMHVPIILALSVWKSVLEGGDSGLDIM